jgi:hypothetical protein
VKCGTALVYHRTDLSQLVVVVVVAAVLAVVEVGVVVVAAVAAVVGHTLTTGECEQGYYLCRPDFFLKYLAFCSSGKVSSR